MFRQIHKKFAYLCATCMAVFFSGLSADDGSGADVHSGGFDWNSIASTPRVHANVEDDSPPSDDDKRYICGSSECLDTQTGQTFSSQGWEYDSGSSLSPDELENSLNESSTGEQDFEALKGLADFML